MLVCRQWPILIQRIALSLRGRWRPSGTNGSHLAHVCQAELLYSVRDFHKRTSVRMASHHCEAHSDDKESHCSTSVQWSIRRPNRGPRFGRNPCMCRPCLLECIRRRGARRLRLGCRRSWRHDWWIRSWWIGWRLYPPHDHWHGGQDQRLQWHG